MKSFAIAGTIVDATKDWKLRIEENCLMVVDQAGKIVYKGKNSSTSLRDTKERYVSPYVLEHDIHLLFIRQIMYKPVMEKVGCANTPPFEFKVWP